MILIDALFINKGGGAVLLQYLIDTILVYPQKDKFFFLLDPRFDKPVSLQDNYAVVPNKMSERIKFYKEHKSEFSKVYPPPIGGVSFSMCMLVCVACASVYYVRLCVFCFVTIIGLKTKIYKNVFFAIPEIPGSETI